MEKSQAPNGRFHTILLPVMPQPDTIAAIFLLKKFGQDAYPGIREAVVEIRQMLPEDKTSEILEQEGYVLIDIGGGRFDHHNQRDKTTATQLVATHLGVLDDPALVKIFEYTRRDDMFGKGTVSEDPIDRAFGLSALIQHLNRSLMGQPDRVVKITIPFFTAHYNEESRRTKELPQEFEKQKANGKISVIKIKQREKKLSVIFLESDHTGMAGFLRSQNGGRFDVVVQRMNGGYVNILTRPTKRPDLRSLVALIRIREAELQHLIIEKDVRMLMRAARHKLIKEWYYDMATNTLQNGGLNPKEIPPTKIPWDEFPRIVELGLSEVLFTPLSIR